MIGIPNTSWYEFMWSVVRWYICVLSRGTPPMWRWHLCPGKAVWWSDPLPGQIGREQLWLVSLAKVSKFLNVQFIHSHTLLSQTWCDLSKKTLRYTKIWDILVMHVIHVHKETVVGTLKSIWYTLGIWDNNVLRFQGLTVVVEIHIVFTYMYI